MNDFVEGQSTSARVLNSTVWTASQLCRAVPRPSVEVLRPVLPVLTQLLVTAGDEEVLVDACWAISYLAEDFAPRRLSLRRGSLDRPKTRPRRPKNPSRPFWIRKSQRILSKNKHLQGVRLARPKKLLELSWAPLKNILEASCGFWSASWGLSGLWGGLRGVIWVVVLLEAFPKFRGSIKETVKRPPRGRQEGPKRPLMRPTRPPKGVQYKIHR